MLTFDYKHFHSQFVIYVYQTFKERNKLLEFNL